MQCHCLIISTGNFSCMVLSNPRMASEAMWRKYTVWNSLNLFLLLPAPLEGDAAMLSLFSYSKSWPRKLKFGDTIVLRPFTNLRQWHRWIKEVTGSVYVITLNISTLHACSRSAELATVDQVVRYLIRTCRPVHRRCILSSLCKLWSLQQNVIFPPCSVQGLGLGQPSLHLSKERRHGCESVAWTAKAWTEQCNIQNIQKTSGERDDKCKMY